MCGIPMTPSQDLGAASERTIERALAHAGATLGSQNTALISEDALRAIRLQFTNYIWIRKEEAACSACGRTYDADRVQGGHKDVVRCPECGLRATVHNLRYGHKDKRRFHQEFYAVEWRKSVLEKDALVMVGVYCGMDCTVEHPERARKVIVPVLLDVFRYGKSAVRFQRSVWCWGYDEGKTPWHVKRDVKPIGSGYFGRQVDVVVSEPNFRAAISGTPFEGGVREIEQARKRHGGYIAADRSEMISALARRPWIEYMIKAGFARIGLAAMYPMSRGVLATRKRSVREIMKLSPDRYAELKGKREDISPEMLELIQLADGAGVKLKLEETQEIMNKKYCNSMYYLRELLKVYGKFDRPLVRFLKKAGYDERREYCDYLTAAREAGINLRDPEVRIPRNLAEAHDRAVLLRNEMHAQKRRAENEKRCAGLQDKLDKRLPELEKKYDFEFDGLVLRPARKLIELIDEGNALGHCVGGYVERYAGGGTDILFLRPADKPDIPWRTIEFSPTTGRLVQDRGYKNDRAVGNRDQGVMTPELRARLDAFWEAFADRDRKKARKSA